MWDISRPLEGDCELVFFDFDDPIGKETFWHSSSHVLGQVLENQYGVKLCHGPPTDNGFFYDSYTGKDIFKSTNYLEIEKAAKTVALNNQIFERLILKKKDALELFKNNPFKV